MNKKKTCPQCGKIFYIKRVQQIVIGKAKKIGLK